MFIFIYEYYQELRFYMTPRSGGKEPYTLQISIHYNLKLNLPENLQCRNYMTSFLALATGLE